MAGDLLGAGWHSHGNCQGTKPPVMALYGKGVNRTTPHQALPQLAEIKGVIGGISLMAGGGAGEESIDATFELSKQWQEMMAVINTGDGSGTLGSSLFCAQDQDVCHHFLILCHQQMLD